MELAHRQLVPASSLPLHHMPSERRWMLRVFSIAITIDPTFHPNRLRLDRI
jgi:hypothetical protein